MKKIAIVVVICLLFALCGCGNAAKVEGKGYKTAEEAALAYAEALKTGDVNKVLATFAIETYVENYDLEEYIDLMNIYMPGAGVEMMMESTDEYTTQVNLINRQAVITRSLSYMYLSMADCEMIRSPIALGKGEYDDASDLVDDLTNEDWMEILADMEIGDVLGMDEFLDKDQMDPAEENLEKSCDYLGCDELQSVAVEVTLDGDDYYLCVDVACYDGVWYNCRPIGTLASITGASSYTGGLLPEDAVD